MIEDLKLDSERWEAERRQTAQRGQPTNGTPYRDANGIVRESNTPVVDYRTSTTHEARQYHGPTEESAAPRSAPAPQGYGQPAGASAQQQPHGYDTGYQPAAAYPSTAYGGQPASGYGPTPQAYGTDYLGGAYVAAANLANADYNPAQATPRGVPVGNQYPTAGAYGGAPTDPRYYAAAPGPSQVPPTQQYGQPTDPYYGRSTYNNSHSS